MRADEPGGEDSGASQAWEERGEEVLDGDGGALEELGEEVALDGLWLRTHEVSAGEAFAADDSFDGARMVRSASVRRVVSRRVLRAAARDCLASKAAQAGSSMRPRARPWGVRRVSALSMRRWRRNSAREVNMR